MQIKDILKITKYRKVRDHCHYACEFRGPGYMYLCICNFKYSVPEEILIVLHNGSNYNYYFIIKKLAEEFEG